MLVGVCGPPDPWPSWRSQGTSQVADFLLGMISPSQTRRMQGLGTLQSPQRSTILARAGGCIGDCQDLRERQESTDSVLG